MTALIVIFRLAFEVIFIIERGLVSEVCKIYLLESSLRKSGKILNVSEVEVLLEFLGSLLGLDLFLLLEEPFFRLAEFTLLESVLIDQLGFGQENVRGKAALALEG